MKDKLTAAEAITGLLMFLESNLPTVSDFSQIMQLAEAFMLANEMFSPRDGWEKYLVMPEPVPEDLEPVEKADASEEAAAEVVSGPTAAAEASAENVETTTEV